LLCVVLQQQTDDSKAVGKNMSGALSAVLVHKVVNKLRACRCVPGQDTSPQIAPVGIVHSIEYVSHFG